MRKNARADVFSQRATLSAEAFKKEAARRNVLASLRATQINASKPVLPAELIAVILDYLPVTDLLRCARGSRRLKEMVYDDTRWIHKLKDMGVWSDVDARQLQEEALKKRLEAQRNRDLEGTRLNGVNGNTRRERGTSVTLFDAGIEEERYRKSLERPPGRQRRSGLADGFEDLTLSSNSSNGTPASFDATLALSVMRQAKSIRGSARQEYGKIHGTLYPFYMDLAKSSSSSDPLVFRLYHQPEQQGQILADLRTFARSDVVQGWQMRQASLDSTIAVFENAVLGEFRQGYESYDVERMRRYASVLLLLGATSAAIDTFIQAHPLMQRTRRIGNPLDCLDGVAYGHVDLGPSHRFFEQLAVMLSEQSEQIDLVFPPTLDVLSPFVTRVAEDLVQEYVNALLDEAHKIGRETYLKAVTGVFEQCMRFAVSIQPSKASPGDFDQQVKAILTHVFEPHVDLYLTEELDFFKQKCNEDLDIWEKQLSEQDAQTESYFMSNVNRQAVKRDFLSSFKKVVMMPVNVLPSFPGTASKTTAVTPLSNDEGRSSTPKLDGNSRSLTPSAEAPTSELAAKTAIMNSRLEGIKSLFSIEVALGLIHYGKASIERAGTFARMGDQFSSEAKKQCEAIFISLLNILGQRHIKSGFDTAVGHLSNYKPHEVKELQGAANGQSSTNAGVEPLVTFLELVNVGDLIQQMVDVFYAQELVATHLTDRDDFLNPAGKEKKRFEQMLDERVAAGMGKGIDVLMDEVEFICATTQLATDFNPGADKGAAGSNSGLMDIGPSKTAKQVVDTISSHTGMLVGSTDKNMLDVFNQEVGLRLFGVICKHMKRQRISVDGAIKLISDINHYSTFISTLRQKTLQPYYTALRELSQIYLIDCTPPTPSSLSKIATTTSTSAKRTSTWYGGTKSTSSQNEAGTSSKNNAKELATIIADTDRYRGIFGAEEVYEFAERRADWYIVRKDVERAMYGIGCCVM